MGLSYGMMGGLAGVGKALIDNGNFLGRQEEADLDMARKTKFQSWLMAAQNEYAVAAEGRAETRAIAGEGRANAESDRRTTRDQIVRNEDDDRKYAKTVERAPALRQIKRDDLTDEADAKLGFETDNIDIITTNEKARANAKQSDADVTLKDAQARFYGDRGDALVANPGKMSEADRLVYQNNLAEAKRLDELHEKLRLEGGWTGTPEQLRSEAKVVSLRRQAKEIANRYAKDAPPATDPQGLRAPAGKPPGMIGPTNSAEVVMRDSVSGPMGADPAALDREISATTEDLKKVTDASSRAQLEAYLASLQQTKAGAAQKPAPAPAKPTVAAPAQEPQSIDALGAQADAAIAEEQAAKSEYKAALATGGPRDEYMRKVESLKAKLEAAKEKAKQSRARYQRAAEGTVGASFNTARP